MTNSEKINAIIAAIPSLAPHIERLRANFSDDNALEIIRISVNQAIKQDMPLAAEAEAAATH